MNYWIRRIEEINSKYGTTFKNLQDVKTFQKRHGLVVDGKIGPKTEAAIQETAKSAAPKGSEKRPFKLAEVEVVAKKPDKTFSRVKDSMETNPIWGKRRVAGVARSYDKNNPFRQANDELANGIYDAGLTYLTGAGIGSGIRYLATQGLKAVPVIAASIGGAAAGQEVLDEAVEGATGKPWDQHLQEAGMDQYGRMLFTPGAWAGSYGAGLGMDKVVQNTGPWLLNQFPRLVMTSQGPITLQPGEQITLTGKPVGYQTSGQGNFGYKAHYTGKAGGARGSSAGQKGHVQTSNRAQASNGVYTRPGSVQQRVMGDVRTGTASGTETYSNPYVEYNPSQWVGWFPWQGESYTPPVVPPQTPPVVQPETRLEEYKPYRDPFLIWYAKQPENTTQYYSGDPIHKAGEYIIKRIYGDPKSTVRLVGDQEGYVVPDSTTIYYNRFIPQQVNVLQGGVPADAVRSTEKITGYKIGGKLKSKLISRNENNKN